MEGTMLVEFRVENHRSLRDEQALSMEKGRVDEIADHRPRNVVGHSVGLLPAAVLYGGNASGKSNVLDALRFMRDAVVLSHRVWPPDVGVLRDSFAWGPKRSEPSVFEVTLILNGVRFQYGFVANDEEFLEEWLYSWPNNKKQTLYSRESDKFKFSTHLGGENKLIEEVTRPNALFLSAAVQLKHEQLQPIFAWFRDMQTINLRSRRPFLHRAPTEWLLAQMLEENASLSLFRNIYEPEGMLERFRSFLQRADLGILDLRVRKVDAEESQRRTRFRRFELKHRCEIDEGWLPLEEESDGTQTLFRVALPVLEATQSGQAILIDELESSLHPILAQEIVRQFNDPASNPKNAQLICATHDTNLLGTTLGKPVLRRDQVWLTEKTPEGATVLYPLTDFKPRKAENLERGYLQGRYGAIPFLGSLSMSGEGLE
jgi:AAA15 family ATPase/GTPase